jgi:hypothetical protein
MAIAWNFSGLAFILLMENQLIKVTLSSSKVEITLFITKKIEKIQERALRFIYNEYTSSYEDLLCKSLPVVKLLYFDI